MGLILPPSGRGRWLGGKAVDNVVKDGLQRKEGSCAHVHAIVRRRRLVPIPQGRIQARRLRVLPMMVVEMAAKARVSSCPCTGEAASSASTAARRDAPLASQNQCKEVGSKEGRQGERQARELLAAHGKVKRGGWRRRLQVSYVHKDPSSKPFLLFFQHTDATNAVAHHTA